MPNCKAAVLISQAEVIIRAMPLPMVSTPSSRESKTLFEKRP
jgi:hypothetical protein